MSSAIEVIVIEYDQAGGEPHLRPALIAVDKIVSACPERNGSMIITTAMPIPVTIGYEKLKEKLENAGLTIF